MFSLERSIFFINLFCKTKKIYIYTHTHLPQERSHKILVQFFDIFELR